MISTLAIRLARTEDFFRLEELGRKYLLEGPYAGQIADNPEPVTRFFDWLRTNESARILVFEEDNAVQGFFAFFIYRHYYGGDLCANELIWCMEKEYRSHSLDLLHAAEKMAFDMGAVRMQLTAPTEEVGTLYKHLKGYALVEVGYQCNLKERMHAGH